MSSLEPKGGCPVFIETAAIPVAPSEGGGSVNIITGQLGSVMKESVNIAYTYARQFVSTKSPDNVFFKGDYRCLIITRRERSVFETSCVSSYVSSYFLCLFSRASTASPCT